MTGPSFRFRLERVRAVRERKEKLAQQELARAISARSLTEAELQSAELRIERAHGEQRAVASGPTTMSSGELLARQTFLERVEAQRTVTELELRQREREVDDRGAELTLAAGEHEMLNRLRDRHRGEHDRDMARRELGVLDEIATMRVGRSSA
ncbi:MAG TPA: flagellar export protein FliJ [Solirubrobacteraceae bacterium]|nr:flagellar export protein FliJ [Solirubrobacteraceae bacterium]